MVFYIHALELFKLFGKNNEGAIVMVFSSRVFQQVEPIWESYLDHSFVKGIGEGTVDEAKFIHYMKQDYVYLIEYSRVFAIGAAKATDLEMMTLFANLLHGTMNFE